MSLFSLQLPLDASHAKAQDLTKQLTVMLYEKTRQMPKVSEKDIRRGVCCKGDRPLTSPVPPGLGSR